MCIRDSLEAPDVQDARAQERERDEPDDEAEEQDLDGCEVHEQHLRGYERDRPHHHGDQRQRMPAHGGAALIRRRPLYGLACLNRHLAILPAPACAPPFGSCRG